MSAAIDKCIQSILPEIVELRHELHQHPETRFEEVWTSERIANLLTAWGIPHQRGLAKGTGIVASIEGEGGKTVALRTDIDGLEVEEATGLPYASRIPNRMHACGHDGHMAVLLGAARVLLEYRDALRGTVKLLFQPGEEQAGGAHYMIADGALEGVDAIFALHGWPQLEAGKIALKSGPLMASADFFRVHIQGKGCHGADPASGIDPVLVAAHITTALQSIVSREIDPRKPAVLTVGHIGAGSTTNIIPDTALLEGTIRSFDGETDALLRQSIERIVEKTAEAFRASAEVRFGEKPYPALINNEAMSQLLIRSACKTIGEQNVVILKEPSMVAEDFACYLEEIPGAFFFLGMANNAEEPYPPLHSNCYDFNDKALPTGIRVMAELALRFLAEE
ncbi:MAG: M20 family metallopeptidase [Candidatus Hydrogenedentota bacterium]